MEKVVEWCTHRFDGMMTADGLLPWQGMQPHPLQGATMDPAESKFFRDMRGEAFKYSLPGEPLFSYHREDMIDTVGTLTVKSISQAKKETDEQLVALVKAQEEAAQQRQLDGLSDGELDWDWIAKSLSAVDLQPHSPIECFCYYYNSLDAAINKGKWKPDEEKRLVELASAYSEHDWIVIADKLGTRRTPMQCLKHYQQSLNAKLTVVSEWTLEEERMLKEAVERYGKHNWNFVERAVPGRTYEQCHAKWRRSSAVHENTVVNGLWTEEEEKRLFLGAVVYEVPHADQNKKSQAEIDAILSGEVAGANDDKEDAVEGGDDVDLEAGQDNDVDTTGGSTSLKKRQRRSKHTKAKAAKSADTPLSIVSWIKVAEVVPGRDDTRCRDKWVRSLDPSLKTDSWTEEEDQLLLKLVDKFGAGHWAQIAQFLHGRTDNASMLRWYKLSGSKKVKEHKHSSKKRKAIVPPSFGRQVTSLTGDDFVEVLKVEL